MFTPILENPLSNFHHFRDVAVDCDPYTNKTAGFIPVAATVSHFDESMRLLDRSFSNFNRELVKLAGPGAFQLSGDLKLGEIKWNAPEFRNLREFSGTSATAPIVSAYAIFLIGQMKAMELRYDSAALEQLLLEGSVSENDLKEFVQDGKVLDRKTFLEFLVKKRAQKQNHVGCTDARINCGRNFKHPESRVEEDIAPILSSGAVPAN